MVTDDIGKHAFDFVERCRGTARTEDLVEEFRATIRRLGFNHSACGCWLGTGANRTVRFFFNDWPEEVARVYAEKDIFSKDPLVFAARRRMAAYTWAEVLAEEPLQPDMRAIFDFIATYNIRDGFCVPVHGPAGYQGLISLLAPQAIELSPRDKTILDMMSRAIHDRCRATVGFGVVNTQTPELSAREIECMKWVAAGKTNWEIGQLLGISKSTVHFHVENVKKKLHKNSRTEAVAILILHGLI